MSKLKPKVEVLLSIKIVEGMQPGTVEHEMNRRKLLKEQRQEDKQWDRLQETRSERVQGSYYSPWRRFLRTFLRYWPE